MNKTTLKHKKNFFKFVAISALSTILCATTFLGSACTPSSTNSNLGHGGENSNLSAPVVNPSIDQTVFTTASGLEVKFHNAGGMTEGGFHYFEAGEYDGNPLRWILLAYGTKSAGATDPAHTAIWAEQSKQLVATLKTDTSLYRGQFLCISMDAIKFGASTLDFSVSNIGTIYGGDASTYVIISFTNTHSSEVTDIYPTLIPAPYYINSYDFNTTQWNTYVVGKSLAVSNLLGTTSPSLYFSSSTSFSVSGSIPGSSNPTATQVSVLQDNSFLPTGSLGSQVINTLSATYSSGAFSSTSRGVILSPASITVDNIYRPAVVVDLGIFS